MLRKGTYRPSPGSVQHWCHCWIINDSDLSPQTREDALRAVEGYFHSYTETYMSAVWYSRSILPSRRKKVEIVKPTDDLRWKTLECELNRACNITLFSSVDDQAVPNLAKLSKPFEVRPLVFLELLDRNSDFMRLVAPVIDEYLTLSEKIFRKLDQVNSPVAQEELRLMCRQLASNTVIKRLEPLAKLTVDQNASIAADNEDAQAGKTAAEQFSGNVAAENESITVELLRDELAPFLM